MKNEFLKLVAAYWPVFMALVGWPVISAVLNVMLWKKTPEQWETWALTSPKGALVVELLRGFGMNPTKSLPALKAYSDRKAGRLPGNAPLGMRVPPSLLSALQDPALMARLEVEATKLLVRSSIVPTADKAAPTPPKTQS